MKRVLYAKYNRTRKPEYQISTIIFEENGKKKVQKEALTNVATAHIQNLEEYARELSKTYISFKFFVPEVSLDGKKAIFPYIEGKTADSELKKIINEKEQLLEALKNFVEKAFVVSDDKRCVYEKTNEFCDIFGAVDFDEDIEAVTVANIDMIPDNIMLSENGNYCLDYEWVYLFPVPVDFLKYRCLFYFYNKYRKQLQHQVPEEEYWRFFGITEALRKKFAFMEKNFQEHIHGKNSEARYTDHYRKNVKQFSSLLQNEQTIHRQMERIVQLQNEEEERNKHIAVLNRNIELMDQNIQLLHHNSELQQEIIQAKSELVVAQTTDIGSLQKSVEQLKEAAEEANKAAEEYKYLEEKAESAIVDKDVHIRNLNAIIEQLNTDILTLNHQINLKENHIHNIEGGYYRWMSFSKNPIIRIVKVPKKIASKVYHRIKDGDGIERLVIPKWDKPVVSIVIPVYNQFDYTHACIKSIIETVKEIPYEIIIGDDESTDATRKIEKYISGVHVNKNTSDHGFLMNCNRAAKLARGEYIVFLNNDTQVKEEWLSSLLSLMKSDDKIGMVGSKLIYPDGRLQEAGGIIWSDATGWNYGREQDANLPQFNYVREVDYISGASIMIRKSLWEKIGGFDSYFAPAYCEDSDLAFQVRQQGYKVMYQPKSVVIHFEGVSNGTDLESGLKKYQVENNKKFKEKWAEELKKQYESGQVPFCARERNHGKKIILFIDHYVPTFDKDAGSKTTFQYIKMFLEKGYLVKFIGDNYAQMEPYTTILQQMGVEVLYGPWYAEHIFEWIQENQEFISVAYMNRPHISEKYVDFLKEKTNIKLIYYGHDLHFLRIKREAELTNDKELFIESNIWKQKEFDIMKKVSMVYYPSYIEEEAIHEIDPSIPVKAITAYVYDKFLENYKYVPAERKGILFVGGFSHGPNIDAVEWFVDEIYSKIREKTNIPFYIVGSNAPDDIKALDGNGIIFKGFVSDEELADLYASCKMVVVPLRYGAGVKGKVVEAIYNGAPIITTSVGAEGILGVEDIVCIEDEPQKFAEKIMNLYQDNEILINMAQKTQQYIKENFSTDAVWNVIKDDFQ